MTGKKIFGGARSRTMGLLTVGMLVGAATAGMATAASASTPIHTLSISAGRAQLCAQGNYAARLTFFASASGGASQTEGWVPAGQCVTYNIPDLGPLIGNPGGMVADIDGKFNTSNNTFLVGTTYLASQGMKIFAEGTTGNGGADSWWNIQDS
jgi:hypothetical protein